ncbi:MAG: rhodanese-like domain-containing protein [Gammaproteobacteria bacterium]
MQQLSEFVINHWILVTAFCAVAGLLIANLLSNAGGVSPLEAVNLINRENAVVIDIRPASEFSAGRITSAINIPQTELAAARERLERYKSQAVLVCCASGGGAATAVRQLRGWGLSEAKPLAGGINAWKAANLPLTAA